MVFEECSVVWWLDIFMQHADKETRLHFNYQANEYLFPNLDKLVLCSVTVLKDVLFLHYAASPFITF